MVVFWVLVLTAFPNAPAHMGKPVQTGALTFQTGVECAAAGKMWANRIAFRPGVRYVDARCMLVVVQRGTKENT